MLCVTNMVMTAMMFLIMAAAVTAQSSNITKAYFIKTENYVSLNKQQAAVIAEHKATIEELNRTVEELRLVEDSEGTGFENL